MDDLQAKLSQPLLKRIIDLLPSGSPVYLVGGAIRDTLINRKGYDLDFSVASDAMVIARKLADELGGAYFQLDPVRKVARIIVKNNKPGGQAGIHSIKVDFSDFQGTDLDEDLRGRDFTINAMAVDVHQLETLIDPLGGIKDLYAKRLRACTPKSIINDPVRILRAVRFSVDLNLKIQPETLRFLRESTIDIPKVSPERLRDELFRILVIPHTSTSLRMMDQLNALAYILPEVSDLKRTPQSTPHVLDAWEHTLDTLNRLESVLEVLKLEYDPDKASSLSLGLVSLQLGRFREQLAEHLNNSLNPDRPHRGLLFLAGLLHDIGKSATLTTDGEGKIRFIGHDQLGGRLVKQSAQALKLSNLEIDRLVTIVSHHMRPSLLSHPEPPPAPKSIYHFFRDTGVAGVDVCILSLADMLATYGATLPQDRWVRHLEVVRTLLGAWWDDREDRIFPPAVIDGNLLMDRLGLSSGPMVGYLLEAIREAQISHDIQDQDGAIDLARKLIQEKN